MHCGNFLYATVWSACGEGDCVLIGTIVKSNSHISYMCRVFGKLESAELPPPSAYSFGTFVTLEQVDGEGISLVGVIRDTFLINPQIDSLGPRLSSDRDLSVFSPDFLNEKGVLVDILVVGWLEGSEPHHGIPALSAQVGTRVETMRDAEVHSFHATQEQKFFAGYLPQLMARNDATVFSLLLTILDRLEPEFPDQSGVIGLLRNNLAWKSRVVPAG